ncbi:PiT family inorganic phosphate transporter [Kitasatospora sp. MAP12-15]|uniref:inorganic phosphate transporter n=1 Tax=unclassified Kitasatospora TaxID=2633591 RepID=UPI002473A9DC|nr:inorganic phosphate transporter [Kitasatospora sp. MAP12-44]MDH6112779.1 PiT family inorganic phosphate transporter [Kitasatospora sp. MAP12-44]
MEHITFLVAVVIITALAFDFTNGFHDTANAMATSIATGALRPKVAVTIAAVLNFAGAFLSVKVASTISGGIVNEKAGIHPAVIFAALAGAILWNLLTWLRGLPSSSSHALYGGLIGATIVGVGLHGVNFTSVVTKIIIPAVASPIVAGLAAWGATKVAYLITRRGNEKTTTKGFKRGQIFSSSLISLAHGTNDAQKTMGVITLTLVSVGALPKHALPPTWVIASAGAAIALGTYMGGWRIIRSMGKGLTDIQSPQGFAAETATTAVILTSTHMGYGLSTTQVVSGGVMGAGLGGPKAQVHWSMARRMVYTWGLTLPAAAVVAGAAAFVADQGTWGVLLVGAVLVAGAAGMWLLSRRQPVTADNVNDVTPVELDVTAAGAPTPATIPATTTIAA